MDPNALKPVGAKPQKVAMMRLPQIAFDSEAFKKRANEGGARRNPRNEVDSTIWLNKTFDKYRNNHYRKGFIYKPF